MRLSLLLVTVLASLPFAFACASSDDATKGDDQNVTGARPGELGGMCGGLAGFRCADGLECRMIAHHPDASGTCVVSAAGGEEVSVEGTMVSVAAIGGETTGLAIQNAQGMTEISLADRASFVEGKLARATGVMKTIQGVEIRERKVLEVKELLSCPSQSTINCMPPTDNPACAPDARSWIQNKCDVSYLD